MANYNPTDITVGNITYKLSDALKNVFSVDDTVDLSICKTAWNKTNVIMPSIRTSSTDSIASKLPLMIPSDKKDLQHYISNHSPRNSVAFNVTYNPAIPKQQINMYPCMVSSGANCIIGTQYDSTYSYYNSTTLVSNSDMKVLTDFKYNHIVCIAPTITGWSKTEDTTTPEHAIPFEDFVTSPSSFWVNGADLPSVSYIWNGTSYEQSGASNINNIRPAYIFNAPWLQGICINGLLQKNGKASIKNYKGSNSADVTTVPNYASVSSNDNTDGISTRLPFGFYINNSTFGNHMCYSLIDLSELKTEIPFDNFPEATSSLVTGTYDIGTSEITTPQYKASLKYQYRVTRTADTRYGYSDVTSEINFLYDGQLYYDLLSGLGVYFVETASTLTGLTPDTLMNSSGVYLGAMNHSGYTICQFLTGTDLRDYDGYNKTGSWDNTGWSPDNPLDTSDEYDTIGLTLNANGASFCHWYAVTQSQMYELLAWCNDITQVPEGLNPMSRIVGVMQAPVSIPTISATTPVSIMFGTNDTHVSGALLGNQGSYSTMHIGDYQYSVQNPTYLSFEPYTKLSLYIPYCGTVDLPPSVFINSTISIDFLYDIFTGECAGVVSRNGTFYTSIGGHFMTTHAISAENMGAIKQAVIRGSLGVVGAGAGAVISSGAGNLLGAGAGLAGMVSTIDSTLSAKDTISPEMRGTMGGRCNFYKPNVCILYKTETVPSDNQNNTKTTRGLPCEKVMQIDEGDGFTVIENPVISGNMTASEKSRLESIYSSGVIL